MIRRNSTLKIIVLGFLFLASCVTPRHVVIDPDNGMQTDPAIVYGVLSNGFQYILMENSKPEDRVNVHLNVFAGSMHETNEQQGVAHYLEHMLFNGSEHYKPGELIEYFQSIGMDFGSDANAHTSFFNTVYDLSLPSADYQQMDDAFVVIQDYAKGALLLDAEIDRERGIIMAEKRERDSVSYRTFKKKLAFELPGSLFSERLPIGIDSVIKKADRKLLNAYYDQWYRPDNMALIVVGDFDRQTVLSMITKRFSKLKPRTFFLKHSLSTKWEEHKGVKPFYHYEPEAGSTDITIETISWEPFETQTPDLLKKRTLNHIADSILQNRLSRMVSKQTADFSEASVFSGKYLRHLSISAISAVCQPDRWKQGLEQIEKTLRQGLLFGFTQTELDRVKADFISSLEKQQNLAESQKSSDLSRKILTAINQKRLLLSPKQRMDFLKPYIESISLQDAHNALKETWAKDHRLVLVSGNAHIAQAPEANILDVYKNSYNDKITRYEDPESKKFPYLELPFSKHGIKSRQDNVKDLGITVIDFKNNIRLNLKKTDFKKNEILFKVCFGQGKKSVPVSKPGLSLLTERVLQSGGLGKLDTDELYQSLAGKEVTMGFKINENYFSLSGSANPEEAELVFQLIYHYLNDPGFRVEALDIAKTRYQQQYDSRIRTPEGIMRTTGDLFLAGNDTRFGLPRPVTINQYTLNDIKDWLIPYFKSSPVEISIIGDFDFENIINLASTYIGAIQKRQSFPIKSINTGKIYFPEGEHLELKMDTKMNTGVVHVAFPTDDFWNIRQTRRLSVLSRVLSERLRIVIREELGETYSPYVYNDPSMSFNGYGILHMVVSVKNDSHQFVFNKIKDIINAVTENGISKKEMDLALKPVINHLKVLRKTNSYWLNSVMANASNYPQKFDWSGNMTDDYKSITRDDLILLAKKYLNNNRSAIIYIKPETHKQ
ncbi:M16 family metallopeptidase [Desulfobacula toluolica]|uniref:PqqL: predicted zinc protease, M16 family n=1 Tax=Desulfobacula toluolica (strain DSM 7467 / Tol2) TaxID=651182 RepID=K0NJQ9_DESTT|nr:M16 family metallopeptidase [Desulfobacula toluolica]CCK81075.1 PqqL: predicted zinc protease, M16 family [Desulfobacula toluolica Tol2]